MSGLGKKHVSPLCLRMQNPSAIMMFQSLNTYSTALKLDAPAIEFQDVHYVKAVQFICATFSVSPERLLKSCVLLLKFSSRSVRFKSLLKTSLT